METNRSNVRDLDEDVRSFLVTHYSENPANPTGVPLFILKRAVPGFRKSSFKDVKRYFREHPDYWMAGQRVLPTTLAASMDVTLVTDASDSTSFDSRTGDYVCHICGGNKRFTNEAMLQSHVQSAVHRMRELYQSLQQEAAVSAGPGAVPTYHQGVEVSVLDAFPTVPIGGQCSQALTLTNRGPQAVVLEQAHLLKPVPGILLSDGAWGCTHEQPQPVTIPPNHSYPITITIKPVYEGLLIGLLLLRLRGARPITRRIEAECGVDIPGVSLRPTEPFKPRARPPVFTDTEIIPGEPPPKTDAGRVAWEVASLPCLVPVALRAALQDPKQLEALHQQLAAPLTSIPAYIEKLQTLLWLEELQYEADIRQYDLEGTTLTRRPGGTFFWLAVPGLAENRPSVLKGDRLYVRPSDGSSGKKEYEGFVHRVEKEEVVLKFHRDFASSIHLPNRKYNVRFAVSRSAFVLMHNACLRVASSRGPLNPLTFLPGPFLATLPPLQPGLPLNEAQDAPPLHPSATPWTQRALNMFKSAPAAAEKLAWVNGSLNAEQRLAVNEVVRGVHAPLPYLIFGPPGTGKTSTLVEAAVQILRTAPEACILLCAPSNSAADLLALRLLGAGRPPSELLRIVAYSRSRLDFPEQLLGISNWDGEADAFTLPSKAEVVARKKRVVVVTCVLAVKLGSLGVPAGHFSHVLMDEAGHAEEPAALCALAGLVGALTRVVLAGDPKQLGPVILSRHAKRHGLAVSLMERLMALEPYRRIPQGSHCTAYITKLVRNYRSHPAILQQPNALFYDNELQPCADAIITHAHVGERLAWDELPNKNFPIIFHGIIGKDEQEGNSPSWFNGVEVKQVIQYVEKLRSIRRNPVSANKIGIITPYRKQVQRIRPHLNRAGGSATSVGTVEQFQGQERLVIIISTVRSSGEYLQLDAKHRLGFLSSPKRFNVAITRAKALLIVVGNPHILAHDPHWRSFIRYVVDNGGYKGCPLPDLADDKWQAAGGEGDGESEAAATAFMRNLNLGGAEQTAAELDHSSAVQVEGGEIRRHI